MPSAPLSCATAPLLPEFAAVGSVARGTSKDCATQRTARGAIELNLNRLR